MSLLARLIRLLSTLFFAAVASAVVLLGFLVAEVERSTASTVKRAMPCGPCCGLPCSAWPPPWLCQLS